MRSLGGLTWSGWFLAPHSSQLPGALTCLSAQLKRAAAGRPARWEQDHRAPVGAGSHHTAGTPTTRPSSEPGMLPSRAALSLCQPHTWDQGDCGVRAELASRDVERTGERQSRT